MRLIEIRDPPVHGDAEQVEDGGRGEDHVHGVVHVAEPGREYPLTIEDDGDGIEDPDKSL